MMSPRQWCSFQVSVLMSGTIRFVIYIFYCIEGGLFLLLVPWSHLWLKNLFFAHIPILKLLGSHTITRGLVSGIGVALLLHGAEELVSATILSLSRRTDRSREDQS